MNLELDNSFIRDVKKAPTHIQKLLPSILQNVRIAQSIHDIPDIKMLKGGKNLFRIKVDDYRIGFYLEQNSVILSRCLNRKDIYRYFPK